MTLYGIRLRSSFDPSSPSCNPTPEQIRELLNEIVSADHVSFPTIKRMIQILPDEQSYDYQFVALFEKLLTVQDVGESFVVRDVFYRNPMLLAKPLVDFVRAGPCGSTQRGIIKEILC